MSREKLNARTRLEDLTELEVYLPFWILMTEPVGSIKSISEINTQRTKRRHERRTESGTAEQPRRIKVPRPLPQISRVIKPIEI